MAGGKPSEMFVKYRFFDMGEKYNPSIHNLGDTIRERGEQFYSEEDLIRMEEELEEERLERLKIARCIICHGFITDNDMNEEDDCRVCTDGHKFHRRCLLRWWGSNPLNRRKCPTSNTIPTVNSAGFSWTTCDDNIDLRSGGKRRKRRYSNKNKNKKNKNHKRNFSKSKKRK